MSHELRTPLNAIIGYSEMLIDDAQDAGDDTNIADLERIKSSGQNLLALINDILDLSKIEAGKMEVYTERFAIAPLIEDVAATIRPIIDKNANTLITKINTSITEMETDKTKLRQNLFNLLSNAAKFTKGGKIELTVDGTDDTINFTIRDEGIGMTAEQKDRLFQAFMQADSSTTRNYGGTGLGLAIVKQFTEMVGGAVDVVSEPGKGSAFTLSYPIQVPVQNDDVPTHENFEMDGRILVIDDDPTARKAMTDLLEAEGYKSLVAPDAHSGLELAAKHRPDAIILDVIMPGQDGWYVLNALKADPELCEIPVILATVLGDRDMGLALGAVDHLTKPIDPQRLVDTLSAYASGSDREALVVDDDPASRALFRRILVREGWTVREASDGVRALAQLEIKLPTIMVLDLMMPNLDGFETLRAVRKSETFQALPVIIATSKDLTRDEIDWLQSNARDVVIKGQTGRSDLMAAIRRTLSSADEKGRFQL
jgi:CheY-like chemotaxis protein/anti-sigma regulatory factor (Ser/Thr protein kinase)